MARQHLLIIIPTPFNAPQITKFQLAPCHKPPMSIVRNELKFEDSSLLAGRPNSVRLPPRGIYT